MASVQHLLTFFYVLGCTLESAEGNLSLVLSFVGKC